jgi:hypothetical protein
MASLVHSFEPRMKNPIPGPQGAAMGLAILECADSRLRARFRENVMTSADGQSAQPVYRFAPLRNLVEQDRDLTLGFSAPRSN